MSILTGNIFGPLDVEHDTTIMGNMMGNAIVRPDCLLQVFGNMVGDVFLEGNGQARITGNLIGVIDQSDASII